jgi:HrpA-like RNA helicase
MCYCRKHQKIFKSLKKIFKNLLKKKTILKFDQSRPPSFELIESLLKYIKGLSIPGAVLIFLPGWNLIFALMKWLQQHPLFGSTEYLVLPLHSQLPREDQRQVIKVADRSQIFVYTSTISCTNPCTIYCKSDGNTNPCTIRK